MLATVCSRPWPALGGLVVGWVCATCGGGGIASDGSTCADCGGHGHTLTEGNPMFLRRCALACWWLVLGLFVLRHPENAAHTVEGIAHGLALAADVLSGFVSAF